LEILLIGHPVLDQTDFATPPIIGQMGLALGETVRRSPADLADLAAPFPRRRLTPGGSAANTASIMAAHGRRVGLVGMIADDSAGRLMAHTYDSIGMEFLTPIAQYPERTTTSLILTTPGGQAATAISIGVTDKLTSEHLPTVRPRTQWVFIEGRVLDQVGESALIDYVHHAHSTGAAVAFSLSGRREVRLHQNALRKIILRCQLVLGTEDEFAELAEAAPLALLTDVSAVGPRVVMTRGSLGAVVAEDGRLRSYTAVSPPSVVDTTGAGDAFAAGFLLSTTAGGNTDDAMTSAATLAAHMVGHLGGWACDCREPIGIPR
jgi:sugar/nucleoside kinase (ribokinase family)